MKTKTLLHIAFLTFLPLSLANVPRENYIKFDYKCLLCKWTAKLIIAYHDEGAKPTQLFQILSKLCSFLAHQDKVSYLSFIDSKLRIQIYEFIQEVCKSMINNVGEQLFAILDASNGTILPVDICGMVRLVYLQLPCQYIFLKPKCPLDHWRNLCP